MDDDELLELARAARDAAGGPRGPVAPESMRGVRGYTEGLATLLGALDGGDAKPVEGACRVCGVVTRGDECARCYADGPARRNVEGIVATLPEGFRWSRLRSPEFERRVRVSPAVTARVLERVRVTMHGPPKAGKTALAVACFRAFVEGRLRGWERAVFAKARALGVARYEWSIAGHGGQAPEVTRAIGASLLVIDDLGNEEVPPNFACLGFILDERHAQNRRTWVTTGLTVAEVTARYGAAIGRRLFVADGDPEDPLLFTLELGGRQSVQHAR